jgi:hypothetical protein
MPTNYYRSENSARSAGRGSRRRSGRASAPRRSRLRTALLVLGALVVVFVLIQFVPYGRDHTDPPVTNAFHWTSPQAKEIARRACYDCHSNKTKYWWAVDIAPFSWLAAHDIQDGRARLNFSEWSGTLTPERLQRAIDSHMPPLQYTLLHPSAKLSAADKQVLMDGFQQSLAATQNGGSGSSSGSSSSSGGSTSSGSSSSSSSSSSATAIIDAQCGSCHSAAPAQQFRASSAAEAQALIDQMIQQGASVTPAQEQALIKYYTS